MPSESDNDEEDRPGDDDKDPEDFESHRRMYQPFKPAESQYDRNDRSQRS